MMRAMVIVAAWAFATVAMGSPVVIQSSTETAKVPGQPLYEVGPVQIMAAPTATPADFKDLYVVLTPAWFALPAEIATSGEVLEFVPTRFAVMRISEQEIGEVSGRLHSYGLACGGVFRLYGDPVVEGIPDPEPIHRAGAKRDHIALAVTMVNPDQILATVEALATIETRYHSTPTGRSVASYLIERYETYANGRSDVTIESYDHGSNTSQDSIRVTIRGQTNPDEVVVLGSHIDSVNWRNGSSSRAPGVDDNASGTATNLEVFRILMEQGITFDRTVEIHGYAAEEIGLVGSQDVASDYRRDGVNVIAMVQNDMNLYRPDGQEDMIWLVTNNTNAALNNQLAQLIDQYAGVPWDQASLSGGSSDHASWTRKGYAAAFPFEKPNDYNPHIHTANDNIANSGSFTQAAAFARLNLAYLAHFAGDRR